MAKGKSVDPGIRTDLTRTARPRLSKGGVSAVILWIAMFTIFLASPVVQMCDSTYSMLTADSLIHNFTPDLSHYSIPDFDADLPFDTVRGNHAYQLVRTNGRLLYGFSHGSSFLSAPFVAFTELCGLSPANQGHRYEFGGEIIIQKILAAIVTATTVTVMFWCAALVLSLPWSALVAVGAGLGTQIWSTASRAMWEHTWEILLAALVIHLLMSAEIRKTRLRPVLLATLLSWMFFVRPTGAIPAVCVSVYVFARWRASFIPLVLIGALWAAAFVAYSMRIFGTVVPFYYLSNDPLGLGFHPAMGLYGILLSPSRGVLVYCPVLAWVLLLTMLQWRWLRARGLVAASLCVIGGIVFASAAHPEWWGGSCYGPRLLTDAAPWFIVLAIMAIDATLASSLGWRKPLYAIGLLLMSVSIAINGYGAWSVATMRWNFSGPSPAIMLDWSRPQFIAGLFQR